MKAKLIIDMPENCYKCPFLMAGVVFNTNENKCEANMQCIYAAYNSELNYSGKKIDNVDIPDWCPLIPIPTKEECEETSEAVISKEEMNRCIEVAKKYLKMRDATDEERQAVNDYIQSISLETAEQF